MSEPLHYIMHIPKTAGLSLQGLVRRRHKKAGALNLIYTQAEVENGFEDEPDLEVVMGHFPFGYHRFSERPFRYYTYLRNPVEHVISHYRYTFDHPEKFEFLPANLKGIIDFANCPYGYNLQTAYASGITDIRGHEDEALARAKQNLANHFKVIGITEEFDLSLLMLAKALGWKLIYYVRENQGKARHKFTPPSPQELAELKELLRWDIELYRYGCEIFDKQKASQPGLLRKLASFRRANRAFQKLNPAYIRLKKLLGQI